MNIAVNVLALGEEYDCPRKELDFLSFSQVLLDMIFKMINQALLKGYQGRRSTMAQLSFSSLQDLFSNLDKGIPLR